jgi:hypothetical protein
MTLIHGGGLLNVDLSVSIPGIDLSSLLPNIPLNIGLLGMSVDADVNPDASVTTKIR